MFVYVPKTSWTNSGNKMHAQMIPSRAWTIPACRHNWSSICTIEMVCNLGCSWFHLALTSVQCVVSDVSDPNFVPFLPQSSQPQVREDSTEMEKHKFRYPRVPRVRLPCDALPPQDWQGMTRTKHDRTQTKHSKYSDHHDLFDYLLLHMCCLVQASSIPTSMSFECFGRQRPENKSLKQWQAVTSSLDISWYTGQHVVPTREVSKFCLSSLRPLTWLPFLPKFLL